MSERYAAVNLPHSVITNRNLRCIQEDGRCHIIAVDAAFGKVSSDLTMLAYEKGLPMQGSHRIWNFSPNEKAAKVWPMDILDHT